MTEKTTTSRRVRVRVAGTVQGVGFRPFVHNLAADLGVSGWCRNDREGVVIEAEGERVDGFVRGLTEKAPPLAVIEDMEVTEIPPEGPTPSGHFTRNFEIRESEGGEGGPVRVLPDTATCPDCLRELFDPGDRRRLYPFINCTNCGPRYSIIRDVPYDRPMTTMAGFTMCAECESEYRDPADRRFHAQPNACPACGPRVWLAGPDGEVLVDDTVEAVRRARRMLSKGAVVAVKGLGGFHLACDAENPWAVGRLRDRKRKSQKPFAVMAPDIERASAFAEINPEAEELLTGGTRPIVLVSGKDPSPLAPLVAPGNRDYGVMLPYTPLHQMLLKDDGGVAAFTALVMTSGNRAEEPLASTNEGALEKLRDLADVFLLHDRDIYMRVDDSIARPSVGREGITVLRRARGFVPARFKLPEEGPPLLACGALLKNTLCLTDGGSAVVGQHTGDLENAETVAFFEEILENLKKTFHIEPVAVARDTHPDYMSSRFAEDFARARGIPEGRVVEVQHHHAHAASCMAEHGLTGPVIAAAFDGAGHGPDGAVWGGEFLVAGLEGYERAGHLGYFGLPGGDAAARKPWVCALSLLYSACGGDVPEEARRLVSDNVDRFGAAMVEKMIERGINTPATSSAGRLFDGVAALAGVRHVSTFEGEAAIALEHSTTAEAAREARPWGFSLEGSPLKVDLAEMTRGVVSDALSGAGAGVISARFHRTLADVVAEVSARISEKTGITDAVLTGGVFQNVILSTLAAESLEARGLKVWTHGRVPPNDGGVSLGQAAVAAARLYKEGR